MPDNVRRVGRSIKTGLVITLKPSLIELPVEQEWRNGRDPETKKHPKPKDAKN
jgi:hypothetical protein